MRTRDGLGLARPPIELVVLSNHFPARAPKCNQPSPPEIRESESRSSFVAVRTSSWCDVATSTATARGPPEECAIREAHEETEVTVDQVRFRAITNDLFTDEQKHYITIWMEGRYREGTARPKAAYELSQVGWFTWDRLPTPLFAPLRRLLDGECYPTPHHEP